MGRIDVSVSLEDIAEEISYNVGALSYGKIQDFILQIDAGVADTAFTEDLIKALREALEG